MTSPLQEIPDAVSAFIDSIGPYTLEQLQGGLSGKKVYQVNFSSSEQESLIVKTHITKNEKLFYEQYGDALRREGVESPQLKLVFSSSSLTWIVLQWIPFTLPGRRWVADSSVMKTLSSLHTSPMKLRTGIGFRASWPPEMSTPLLDFLPSSWTPIIEMLRKGTQPLFDPQVLISGDPNPTNWGLLDDGTAILYDWDRFGMGTPALDVAISIPGLGSLEDYERCAYAYSVHQNAALYPSQLALAKLWAIAEFINTMHQSPQMLKRIEPLITEIPNWLENVVFPMHL